MAIKTTRLKTVQLPKVKVIDLSPQMNGKTQIFNIGRKVSKQDVHHLLWNSTVYRNSESRVWYTLTEDGILTTMFDHAPIGGNNRTLLLIISAAPGETVSVTQQDLDDAMAAANAYTDEEVAKEALLRGIADNDLDAKIAAEAVAREAGDADLANAINKINATTVQKDTDVTGNDSTVLVTKTVGPISGEDVEVQLPLPVASESQAGVINMATYTQIQESAEKIDVILNGSIYLPDVSSDPAQDELTRRWKETTGRADVINGARITNQGGESWTYFANTDEWVKDSRAPEPIEITNFTNYSAGLIRGDDVEGKVFAEADGTGSVKGWDAVKAATVNNGQAITRLEANDTAQNGRMDGIDEEIAGLKKKDTDIDARIDKLDNIYAKKTDLPNIVQETGASETDLMSQKATTDALNGINGVVSLLSGLVSDLTSRVQRLEANQIKLVVTDSDPGEGVSQDSNTLVGYYTPGVDE